MSTFIKPLIKSTSLGIFLSVFVMHKALRIITGLDAYALFGDSIRYDMLSDQIIRGIHDLDLIAFVSAPLFPYLLALLKLVFQEHWLWVADIYQFSVFSISACFVFKLSKTLFNNTTSAFVSTFLYALNPMILWYNLSLSQETSFMAFFIIALYHLHKYVSERKYSNIIFSSIFLSLSFMTKSHIGILILALAVVILAMKETKAFVLFSLVTLLCISPILVRNISLYDSVSFSNFSFGSMLMAGHADETYPCLAGIRNAATDNQDCDLNMIFNPNHNFNSKGKINLLAPKERNSSKIDLTLSWMKANPGKVIRLKLRALYRFILPSVDPKAYSNKLFLFSLFIGLIMYLPAYFNIYRRIKIE